MSRLEQLRLAKRAQRERERAAGKVIVPLKLAASDAERMRVAMKRPAFTRQIRRLLDEELIEIAAYEGLKGLCWSRSERYIAAEEAFRLYERNWRFVDTRRMAPAERKLIDQLTERFGNGVLLHA